MVSPSSRRISESFYAFPVLQPRLGSELADIFVQSCRLVRLVKVPAGIAAGLLSTRLFGRDRCLLIPADRAYRSNPHRRARPSIAFSVGLPAIDGLASKLAGTPAKAAVHLFFHWWSRPFPSQRRRSVSLLPLPSSSIDPHRGTRSLRSDGSYEGRDSRSQPGPAPPVLFAGPTHGNPRRTDAGAEPLRVHPLTARARGPVRVLR